MVVIPKRDRILAMEGITAPGRVGHKPADEHTTVDDSGLELPSRVNHSQEDSLLTASESDIVLLEQNGSSVEVQHTSRKIYVSHALSTWNSRLFEFGSVLFLSTIYPQTLLPASLYALVRAASAIVFGSSIGRIIDRRDRLFVLRISIGRSYTCCSLEELRTW